jgi:hypothetical protein
MASCGAVEPHRVRIVHFDRESRWRFLESTIEAVTQGLTGGVASLALDDRMTSGFPAENNRVTLMRRHAVGREGDCPGRRRYIDGDDCCGCEYGVGVESEEPGEHDACLRSNTPQGRTCF